MWFIGVEVEQETSAPPPKKNPGSAPVVWDKSISDIVGSAELRKQKHENKTERSANFSRAFFFRVFPTIWEPETGYIKRDIKLPVTIRDVPDVAFSLLKPTSALRRTLRW